MIAGFSQIEPTDAGKQLVHLAIAAGRSLQSSQTGFLHYNYRQIDYPFRDTIPLYENFLFALALLRDRTSENFNEGKSIFLKLLNFQSFEEEGTMGNFPVYLHQYPLCADRDLGARLLPIFYWALRTFPIALGPELRERLNTAARLALNHCLQVQNEQKTALPIAILTACSQEAFGRLWQEKELETAGIQALETLRPRVESEECSLYFCPGSLGQVLAGLQMVFESFVKSAWSAFWERLCLLWHVQLAAYVGPALKVPQAGEEAEPTLFDLYMGFFSKRFSQAAFVNRPYQLQGALIQPSRDTVEQPSLPFEYRGKLGQRAWQFRQEERYAVALLQKERSEPATDASYSPFRLVWGDVNIAHSFALQGGNTEHISYSLLDDGVNLFCSLPKEVPTEAKQRNRELLFFVDAHEDLELRVNGEKATTFRVGDTVLLRSSLIEIALVFTVEGRGEFFGHLSLGNRPAQVQTEGESRGKAFDWQIFLRTVGREPEAHVKVAIKWKKGPSSLS